MKRFLLFVGIMLLLVPNAYASSYFSGTSLLSAPVIDFEGYAEGALISNQFSGVTFGQDDGGTPMIDNLPPLYSYQPIGNGCLTGSTTGGAWAPTIAGITATFDSGVSAVEAWFTDTAPLGDYSFTAWDSNDVVIENLIITLANLGNVAGYFVGFSSGTSDIWKVQFGRSSVDGDAFAIDNFKFASNSVPEPTTLLLLGFGILGLAGIRRKS